MKNTHICTHAPVIALAGLIAVLNSGCGQKETGTSEPKPLPGQKAPAIVSAEKTSFDAVTSKLDPGGSIYVYLSTQQWLDGLSTNASNLRQIFIGMPELNDQTRANINKGFDIGTRLIKESGIEDISGVGMSGIASEKGLYRSKTFVHHYPGKGTGFLWNVLGKQPHPLTGLDLLPTNVVLAAFSDLDLPLTWSFIQKHVNQSGFPQAQEWLNKLPAGFEQLTQLKLDQVLASLGGEYGFVITFDESKMIPIPMPGSGSLQIPEPGLLIVAKVKDDTIFDRVDRALKEIPQLGSQVISTDKPGLKMRTLPLPLPLPIQLRPTVASSGGYLFIASTDGMIQDVLAVKAGQKPGLKSTEEFKRVSQGIPQAGNGFTFMSQHFGDIIFQVQRQVIASAAQSAPTRAAWLQSLMQPGKPTTAYSVSANTDEGWLTVGNGSQNPAAVALVPLAVVPAMLAAIAIPNFVKARSTAQQNACINNLRQIDVAKEMWALENKKAAGDTPTWADLKPYLGRGQGQINTCPAGGTYTINAVGKVPTCSQPGHTLAAGVSVFL
jgi:hypothetical protein